MKNAGRKHLATGLIMALLLVPSVQTAVAAEQGSGVQRVASATQTHEREAVVKQLIAQGASPAEAEVVVAALTSDDIAVIAANPQMMQPAGDGGDVAAGVGIALLIIISLGLIAAAAAA